MDVVDVVNPKCCLIDGVGVDVAANAAAEVNVDNVIVDTANNIIILAKIIETINKNDKQL